LRAPSVIRCGKLMTLDRSLLTGRLGQFSAHLMAEVNARLKIALELP
jgi:mRNA-degrading endonuclease toxin of MazEF toxin-antitoxin module